jgi:hypothetical protein
MSASTWSKPDYYKGNATNTEYTAQALITKIIYLLNYTTNKYGFLEDTKGSPALAAYNDFVLSYLTSWRNDSGSGLAAPFDRLDYVDYLIKLVTTVMRNSVQEKENSLRKRRLNEILSKLHARKAELSDPTRSLIERLEKLKMGGKRKQTRRHRKSRKHTRKQSRK